MASCVPGCRDSPGNPAPHVLPAELSALGRRGGAPHARPLPSLQGLPVALRLGEGCGSCLCDLPCLPRAVSSCTEQAAILGPRKVWF